MPIIQVTLLEGYADEVKARLCKALSAAARSVIPAPPEATTVAIAEVSRAGFLRGEGPPTPAPAAPDPEAVVRAFLAALEARDLPAARALMAEGAPMTFPGGAVFETLEALVNWARPRYRFVKKRIDRIESLPADGGAVVWCFGTLNGEWPDGAPFEGIRFVDRFEIAAGLIRRQDVWNDMGEMRGEMRGEVHGAAGTAP
jgi:phenylpyruvate tautomerase PptA (4-oxalocrotonate tautomerase family)